MFRKFLIVWLVLCSLPNWAQEIVSLTYYPDGIEVKPLGDFKSFTFTANGRDGANCVAFTVQEDGRGFAIKPYDELGNLLPDGLYKFRIEANPYEPIADPKLREGRCNDDDPKNVFANTFRIDRGLFVEPGDKEEQKRFSGKKIDGNGSGSRQDTTLGTPLFDFVINDDLIVDGSACIGFDCVNGESFGFDTIRLKENNLRIKFDDTSVAASFPRNDWQLTANDSANGGLSKFSIDDISGGRTPFTVEANAPSHSLYVDDGGRLGLGTSTPSVELHMIDGDTPTLRLQQDGTSGFAPQTWDVAGNETNFFVRDVTNGSSLPLRIRPGADTSSLHIAADSAVGVGTSSPDARLHIDTTTGEDSFLINNDGSAGIDFIVKESKHVGIGVDPGAEFFVINMDGTGDPDLMFSDDGHLGIGKDPGQVHLLIEDAGSVSVNLRDNTVPASNFKVIVDASGYRLKRVGGTSFMQLHATDVMNLGNNLLVEIDAAGNVTATSHANSSDVNLKEDFEVIDPLTVLDKVLEMPVTSWRFKDKIDPTGRRHIGPMAQDFHAAFGLGDNDKVISTTDIEGVALAAIQGLNQKIQSKDAQLSEMKARLQAQEEQLRGQEARLKALEKLLNP